MALALACCVSVMMPRSPPAATPPSSPGVVAGLANRDAAVEMPQPCGELEYAVLSGDRKQLAARYADGGGVILDAAAAAYTHVDRRGEVGRSQRLPLRSIVAKLCNLEAENLRTRLHTVLTSSGHICSHVHSRLG